MKVASIFKFYHRKETSSLQYFSLLVFIRLMDTFFDKCPCGFLVANKNEHLALPRTFPPFLLFEFTTCGAVVVNVMDFFH